MVHDVISPTTGVCPTCLLPTYRLHHSWSKLCSVEVAVDRLNFCPLLRFLSFGVLSFAIIIISSLIDSLPSIRAPSPTNPPFFPPLLTSSILASSTPFPSFPSRCRTSGGWQPRALPVSSLACLPRWQIRSSPPSSPSWRAASSRSARRTASCAAAPVSNRPLSHSASCARVPPPKP